MDPDKIVQKASYHLGVLIDSSAKLLGDCRGMLAFGGKLWRKRRMADTADDLGIPNRLVRPSSGASGPDGLRPAGEPPAFALTPSHLRGGTPENGSLSWLLGSPQAVASADTTVEPRKLVVGEGTALSGEINACDRIVVEGTVRANLQKCQRMTIAQTGLYDGSAAIDDAEIHGRFEGNLVVHNRLIIRSTGRVSGTITYGEIEIEAGGRIAGTVHAR